MQIRPVARYASALLSCAFLAACGGGGGGSTPTPITTPGPGSNLPTRSVVRSDAQAILTAGKVLGTGGYAAGGPPLAAMAVARHIESARRSPQAVQCSSGGISGVGSVSFSSSTDAQGNQTQVYGDYYDANCQQAERIATLVFPPGSSLSSGSITGTTTEYDRTATVIGYATFQSSYTPTTLTLQTADAKTVGGAVVGHSGATCIASSNSPTETCGLASFATVGGTTTGLTESITETFTSTGQITGTIAAQLAATTFTGAGLTLVPPSSGTAWGLSGGTQLDSTTGTGNATVNGSITTSATYSFNDATAGITASGSISGTSLTVTLVQGSTTLATVTIDADGNGSVTYADSSKETVAGFTIFG